MANCFSRPAQMSTRSRGPSSTARARSTKALKFTGAPTSTGSPPCAATRAGVPFVVASTIVLPATTAGTISRGELPSAKPSILTLRRSPASSTPSFSRFDARRTASSEVAAGITALAPFARAVMIVVVAAVRQGRDDCGRRAQDVDDDDAPAGEIPRAEAERREVDVD